MIRFDGGDDPDDDLDDEFDDEDDDENGEDEEDDEDEDKPETWQVGESPQSAKSWHRLTSGFELPRLAPIFQLSQRWNITRLV